MKIRTTGKGAIQKALRTILSHDVKSILIGEDIGIYGGAFGCTTGIKKEFPYQIIDTPISESGFTGLATGLALSGYRPIVEYMFMDFMAQAVDQILNQATKFEGMYNNQVQVPVLYRTPAGGYNGYGPTHSQSLENIFASIPNLEIVYPYSLQDCYSYLIYLAQNITSPVLFIEDKNIYKKIEEIDMDQILKPCPKIIRAGGDTLIISYGHCLDIILQTLISHKQDWTVIDLSTLKPINIQWFEQEIFNRKYKRICIITESPSYASISEHLAYLITQSQFYNLDCPVRIISGQDSFIPARQDKELEVLVNSEKIWREINI